MTGPRASDILSSYPFVLVLLSLFVCNGSAWAAPAIKPPQPMTLLLEARTAAASIQDLPERSATLDQIIVAQIQIDPAGARETLKIFPKQPNKLKYFTSLASTYAETGNIAETERMYAEILVEDHSSRPGKLAAAHALGQLVIAYANRGNIEEALQTLSRVKERAKDEPLAIVGIATARLAEAQAKQGDIRGAIQTALSIIGENPYPLMKIVRDRVQNGQAPDIVATLDEGPRRYAQWGIVQAQIQQGRLTDAQVTASSIKPGHAKASALLELATYHLQHGAKPLALVLLQEAETSARSTLNTVRRADILRHIAASTAMAGDAATAINIAKSIEQEGHRASAIHDIVNAQAKRGDISGAFNTAIMLRKAPQPGALEMSDYEMAISNILVELVKSGKPTEARDTVASFQHIDIDRAWLYSGIAVTQADLGNIKDAKDLLAQVETESQRIARKKELVQLKEKIQISQNPNDVTRSQELWKREFEVRRALEAIAKALARKGDLFGAMAAADELNVPAHRLELIKELSAFHAKAGRTEQTLRWARNLSSPSEKAYALVGIATALSQSADKPKAKPAFFSSFSRRLLLASSCSSLSRASLQDSASEA